MYVNGFPRDDRKMYCISGNALSKDDLVHTAFNLSNIRVKCRYSSILLRAMITRIDDKKLPNPDSRPVETHDVSVWIMVHASFR